jgi:mannose-1-phosphate guanylyltransferase
MGTAGGIHHFRDEILRGNPDAFFVLNGDIASSFPLQDVLHSHKKAKAAATVLTMHMDKKKLSQYGCIVVDKETNKVNHFVENPETFVSDLISCGVYLFGKEVFGYIQTAMESRREIELESGIDISQFAHKASLAASNAALSARSVDRVQMENDVLPLLASNNLLYAHVMSDRDFWMPIKAGSSCISANRRYLQYFMKAQPKRLSQPVGQTPLRSTLSPVGDPLSPTSARNFPEIISPVIIHPTAVIHPSAKIGPNVYIGPRALIGRGVRIRDALILDGVEVKNDACILNAVVGWESKIGAWTRVEGSTPQEDAKDAATQKGFKIPNAVIFGKGVTVTDEVIVRDCIVLPHKDLKSSFQREILM